MESIEENTSTLTTPPISISVQYPTHDPPLATQISISRSFISLWAWCFQNWSVFRTAQWFESSNSQNELEAASHSPDYDPSIPTRDEQRLELTSPTRVAIEHEDPSIPTRDEQPSNRLHINSDSKNVTYWIRLFSTCLVPVVMNYFWGKHNRLAAYCFKISIAIIVMASIILIIHECLRSSNSSNQNLSPDRYKSLIYVYYMLCIFAYLLLLPVFIIPDISLNPSPLPPPLSPPPPPHPQLHHH